MTNAEPAGTPYAELHCHTSYSFKDGASSAAELLLRARDLGLAALAVTDHDNLCGAMEFAQAAKTAGIKPIIGVELTLTSGHHVTLLAENAAGYRNICRLTTRAHMDPPERNQPALDPTLLASHAEGVVCLSGCRNGEIASLVDRGHLDDAAETARRYARWFGNGNFFLELQQNLVRGDTARNRLLARIGRELGIPTVATNNVHYHIPERSRLNDALVAIRHNKSLEETHRERRPNDQFHLKPPDEMAFLFVPFPEAIANTTAIAGRCDFDLTSAPVYQFPDYPAPGGHTPVSWLRALCEEAAVRRYDAVTQPVIQRLNEEFRLIEKHGLAGFLLQYYDIIRIAREVQEDLGLIEPGLPLEEQPPGRGRGSSVALLIGYLIGLSHIDPLQFDLKLDRFLPEELSGPPDIDLDFPREIREELILRVHKRWGYDRAVLTGMISTYRIQGAVRDLGKALGLPLEDVDRLTKRVESCASVRELEQQMRILPEYRDHPDVPLWRDLIDLAVQLGGFPKYLAQHPGGMILSARPLSETVPLQRSAIDGRYICQWDKDSADDAGFVKIDFLALGALSQMTEALELIRKRTETRLDLSRIDFEDPRVYAAIHEADTIGVFQIESAAQMQTVTRLRPKNLVEMAWEVGAVRPGVGVNDGVTMLIRRHTGIEKEWDYDHLSERPALERTYGVVLYQDQLIELAVHVAGMSAADGDRMRRAYGRRNSAELIPAWREKFIKGARERGVPLEAAEKIVGKFHGLFQFPESHAFAFAITAYQMSWLKLYYPIEFYTGLFNQQPMGFYNLETLKEDARRHNVRFLHPDVNRSHAKATIEDDAAPSLSKEVRGRTFDHRPELVEGPKDAIRLGLTHVKTVREATAAQILAARNRGGPFKSLSDFMRRTGIRREPLDNLIDAGALLSLSEGQAHRHPEALEGCPSHPSSFQGEAPDEGFARPSSTTPRTRKRGCAAAREERRTLRWEAGLRYTPIPPYPAPVPDPDASLGQEHQRSGHRRKSPRGAQLPLDMPVEHDMVALPGQSEWDLMMAEYNTMGLYPNGHIMAMLRPSLPPDVTTSDRLKHLPDGAPVRVAGVVIRRQRPLRKATFITLEDEFGHSPLVLWPKTYNRLRLAAKEPILLARGKISRRDGTMNIVATDLRPIPVAAPPTLKSKDWG